MEDSDRSVFDAFASAVRALFADELSRKSVPAVSDDRPRPAELNVTPEMLKRERGGVTMVLIEHDMGVVFDVVDRLIVLHHGRVVADGPLESIRGDAQVQEIYLGGKL